MPDPRYGGNMTATGEFGRDCSEIVSRLSDIFIHHHDPETTPPISFSQTPLKSVAREAGVTFTAVSRVTDQSTDSDVSSDAKLHRGARSWGISMRGSEGDRYRWVVELRSSFVCFDRWIWSR